MAKKNTVKPPKDVTAGTVLETDPEERLRDRALETLEQELDSDDGKVRLQAAKGIMTSLGKPVSDDKTLIDPEVNFIMALATMFGPLGSPGDRLALLRKMAKTCSGCPRLGIGHQPEKEQGILNI